MKNNEYSKLDIGSVVYTKQNDTISGLKSGTIFIVIENKLVDENGIR